MCLFRAFAFVYRFADASEAIQNVSMLFPCREVNFIIYMCDSERFENNRPLQPTQIPSFSNAT